MNFKTEITFYYADRKETAICVGKKLRTITILSANKDGTLLYYDIRTLTADKLVLKALEKPHSKKKRKRYATQYI